MLFLLRLLLLPLPFMAKILFAFDIKGRCCLCTPAIAPTPAPAPAPAPASALVLALLMSKRFVCTRPIPSPVAICPFPLLSHV